MINDVNLKSKILIKKKAMNFSFLLNLFSWLWEQDFHSNWCLWNETRGTSVKYHKDGIVLCFWHCHHNRKEERTRKRIEWPLEEYHALDYSTLNLDGHWTRLWEDETPAGDVGEPEMVFVLFERRLVGLMLITTVFLGSRRVGGPHSWRMTYERISQTSWTLTCGQRH